MCLDQNLQRSWLTGNQQYYLSKSHSFCHECGWVRMGAYFFVLYGEYKDKWVITSRDNIKNI